jgi:ATP/maltotriose-dependent transcriptional regulator MalT
MKPQQYPLKDILVGGSRSKMRVLKSPGIRKSNSKRSINDLLTSLMVKGNKAEDILRRTIRKIIQEELNFFIDQNKQQESELSSGFSEKLPVIILNNYRKLTAKETEVMDLILLGFTNRKIATRLIMKLSTVKNHIKSINNKFGVNDRKSACSVYRKLYNKPGLMLK